MHSITLSAPINVMLDVSIDKLKSVLQYICQASTIYMPFYTIQWILQEGHMFKQFESYIHGIHMGYITTHCYSGESDASQLNLNRLNDLNALSGPQLPHTLSLHKSAKLYFLVTWDLVDHSLTLFSLYSLVILYDYW